jgi:hypothetical protein
MPFATCSRPSRAQSLSGHDARSESTSPLTGGPPLAANPPNAVLNYLYALLEGEATLATRMVGLDPGLGVLHADQLNRDSLAADRMEPVRPIVDRFVLGLLTDRVFRRDVLPAIQGVPLREPARRTGLSVGYLARVRRGEEVPHARWWGLLAHGTPTRIIVPEVPPASIHEGSRGLVRLHDGRE